VRCWLLHGAIATRGVRVSLGASLRQYSSTFSGVYVDASQEANRKAVAADGPPDWGITFYNVSSVVFVDSVVRDVPFSTAGPLLQCMDCGSVSVRNLTVTRVAPPTNPAVSDLQQLYGVVHLSGLTSADLEGFTCTDVTGASGWACLLAWFLPPTKEEQAAGGGAGVRPLTITNSTISRNSVQWPGNPDTYTTCDDDHGFGAVAVDSETSDTAVVRVVVARSTLEGNVGGCGGALTITKYVRLVGTG
jgi:hypothetical protein